MLEKAPMGPQWLEETKSLVINDREIPVYSPYTERYSEKIH